MVTICRDGDYKVCKDGSSYYRVFRKRTRIGSFLFIDDAITYMNTKAKQAKQS